MRQLTGPPKCSSLTIISLSSPDGVGGSVLVSVTTEHQYAWHCNLTPSESLSSRCRFLMFGACQAPSACHIIKCYKGQTESMCRHTTRCRSAVCGSGYPSKMSQFMLHTSASTATISGAAVKVEDASLLCLLGACLDETPQALFLLGHLCDALPKPPASISMPTHHEQGHSTLARQVECTIPVMEAVSTAMSPILVQ